MKILILSATENSNNKAIQKAAIQKNHECEIVSPEDILINYLPSGKATIYIKEGKVKNNYFDAVIPRLGKKFGYGCHVLRHLENFTNVFSTATAEGLEVASDKLRSTIYLVREGLPVPKTTTVQTPDNFKFLIDTVDGLPAICKSLKGSQGAGVYIFNDELQSSVALKNFRKEKKNVLLQQFIETAKDDKKKSDIRAWVVGNRVVAAFKRLSTDSDFRSNYTLSKEGEKVELTKDEKELAVKAAKAVGLHCAGVDIARDANDGNKPYILEINGNASLTGITAVTGINIPAAIIAFVEENVVQRRQPITDPKQLVQTLMYFEHVEKPTNSLSSYGLKTSGSNSRRSNPRGESVGKQSSFTKAAMEDSFRAQTWNNPFSGL